MKPTVVATLIALLASPAIAQERRPSPDFGGEAIIYRDTNYSGPAVNVSRAQSNLGLAWPVRSIRVRSGRWELCTLPSFRGPCATIERDTPNLNRGVNVLNRVGSMRPLPGGGGPRPPEPPAPERSLRGMAAEFFPAPAERGRRVEACESGQATANCAARTADRFCAGRGWNGAAHQALETMGRRVYLADTLCVRSGY